MHPTIELWKDMAAERGRKAWLWVQAHPWKAGLWGAVAVPALLALYVLILVPFTPGIGDIRKAKTEQPAIVLSADGKELAAFRRANRDWVALSDISPSVTGALIATEDHRFYQHHGIDLKRTAAAVFHTAAGRQQGGSTITQQLARNLYPEDIGRAPTLTRKIKEAITALKIEAVYTKDEILETYLNTVPFLYNAQGIEMAARTYFDKSANKLDVLESATLIGMLKGTSYYNPVLNPERAKQRRNLVLAQMVKHNKLPEAKLKGLQAKAMKIDFERQDTDLGAAPHFTQQLRRWLVDWADKNGYSIYDDGLRVQTTIDSRLQEMANDAVERQADKLQKVADGAGGARAGISGNKAMLATFVRESAAFQEAHREGEDSAAALKRLMGDAKFMKALIDDKTRLQAGFLAVDPQNGQVRAWVGSRDFSVDQFDHVAQARRQPGSTFKPFVYGAAFEQGARPTDTFLDQAVEIRWGRNTVWRPTDAGQPSGGEMSLRQGLAYSKNTITAQVMQQVGPSKVAQLAHAMGIRQSKLDEVPSLALGTSPVTLMEMVSAYGTIANGGSYIQPVLVTQIVDRNGKVLETFAPKAPEPAMSNASAQTLLDVMRGVIDQGTGTGIRSQFGIQADVAGKTGTTQNNTDGWFILMHPQVVGGAWMGFNDNRVTMRSNYWGQGAHNALFIVGDFFQQGLKRGVIRGDERFPAPRLADQPELLQTVDGATPPMESDALQVTPAPDAGGQPLPPDGGGGLQIIPVPGPTPGGSYDGAPPAMPSAPPPEPGMRTVRNVPAEGNGAGARGGSRPGYEVFMPEAGSNRKLENGTSLVVVGPRSAGARDGGGRNDAAALPEPVPDRSTAIEGQKPAGQPARVPAVEGRVE